MACRSVTGFGSSRDGGSGIPGVPQLLSSVMPSRHRKMVGMALVVGRNKSVSEENQTSREGPTFSRAVRQNEFTSARLKSGPPGYIQLQQLSKVNKRIHNEFILLGEDRPQIEQDSIFLNTSNNRRIRFPKLLGEFVGAEVCGRNGE